MRSGPQGRQGRLESGENQYTLVNRAQSRATTRPAVRAVTNCAASPAFATLVFPRPDYHRGICRANSTRRAPRRNEKGRAWKRDEKITELGTARGRSFESRLSRSEARPRGRRPRAVSSFDVIPSTSPPSYVPCIMPLHASPREMTRIF